MTMSKKKTPQTPGPAAKTLKLDGDWQDLMGKALAKPRPARGFPKPRVRKKSASKK